MKRLYALALSDLHLGEPEGLLNNVGGSIPNIKEKTVNKIAELARAGEDLEEGIEQLILVGDIVELSEASPAEAYASTKTFLTALLDQVTIDKIIYLPGNHDHRLWVEILKEKYGRTSFQACRPKTGGPVLGPQVFIDNCLPPSYRGQVEAHYPFYLIKLEGSHFLFDHGHLFSRLLTRWAGPVASLEELEEKTEGFMEAVWYRGEIPWRERLHQVREWIYDMARWTGYRVSYSTRGVSFREDAAAVLDDGLRERLVNYLKLKEIDGLLNETTLQDFHLVFGHTHQGGRVLKADRNIRVKGRFITLWNTGGWLVPAEVFSPDAYIFYIERTPSGPLPQAYKLAAMAVNEEGDYPREILKKIVKTIG